MHGEDNHEDLTVEIRMKRLWVLGAGWESGHIELLFSEWWDRVLYIRITMYSIALNMPLSPLPHSQTPWSIAVRAAYQKIYQIYHTGSSYVDSGNVEAHRLQQYGQSIIVDAYPILLLLTQTAESESLPLEWVETITTEFTTLLTLVDERWMSAKDKYVQCILAKINLKFRLSRSDDNVTIPQPVHQACTGKCGRPRKNVDPKKHSKQEDEYLHQFLQVFLALVEQLSTHRKMRWA